MPTTPTAVLGPEAACLQEKRRLGRPSVESLNTLREALATGDSGRTLSTALEGRGSRASFASHFPKKATLQGSGLG